jgi:NAD(P)-dependent dehydrogenase (short-subunit alcohol dehydrogenase family)
MPNERSEVSNFDPLSPGLLRGRTALITGGGTGLGLSMGKRFAQLGADVVICGRREAVLREAVEAISMAAPARSIWSVVCDIRDPDAVGEMMSRIWQRRGLDILVNNAAASFIAQTHMLSHRAVDAILGVTLHGALYCTIEAGRRWIEAKTPGVVLSILSTSTVTGRAFTTPSAMAKSGLLAMTRSLAVEWGPRKIRLVAIAPGPFPTPGARAQLNPASRQNKLTEVPLGRIGQHQELANLAAFLVSDGADFMTGEMVCLDGGLHLRTSGADDLLGWTDEQWAAHRASLEGRNNGS